MTRRTAGRVLGIALVMGGMGALPVAAEPQTYELEKSASRIDFIYHLNGAKVTGKLPVARAGVVLDFDNLAASEITVVMAMAQVRAGIFLATDVIKSPSVLSTAAFPEAVFVSRQVRAQGNGAVMQGDLTLRGVTRPITMDVQFFRQSGTESGDLSKLVLSVRGVLQRSEFGAVGYPALVGEQIELRILAVISGE